MLGLYQVMAENGYEGASIPAIARAAGLAPGLVHYHFETKLEILVELVQELSARLEARFERRRARADSAWAELEAFIDAHVALGKDADPRAVACWVVIGAEALRHADVQGVYRRALSTRLARAEELVQAVLDAEAREPREASSIAAALVAAIEGTYQLSVAAGAIPKGSAAPMIRRVARGLIRAAPIATIQEVNACR